MGKVKCRARAKSGTNNISRSRPGSGCQYFNLWPFGNVSHSVPQRSLGLEAPVSTEGTQIAWQAQGYVCCVEGGFCLVVMEPSQNRTPLPRPLCWNLDQFPGLWGPLWYCPCLAPSFHSFPSLHNLFIPLHAPSQQTSAAH